MKRRQDIIIRGHDLTLFESGTYPEQFLRPYTSELNGSLIDSMEERFNKTRRFTPSILASIANQFIVPDFRPRGIIEIPNGWSERRGRFLLTLDIEIGTGDHLRQIVIGYTNSVGFTTRNTDPDMEFYINNTFILLPRTIRTERGSRQIWTPSHVNDVMSDRNNDGLRGRGPRLYTMRPEDVYSSIDSQQTTDLVDDVIDLRTTLSRNSIKSSTSNRLTSRYLSRILDSRQKALNNTEYANSVLDVNAQAQGYVQESYASDDVFLRAISNVRGMNMTTDMFTMRDLMDIDPDIDRVTNRYLLDDDTLSRTRYNDESNRMDGQEEEDRIAALVTMAVPALMMENAIHMIEFQAHNQGYDDRIEFVPISTQSIVRDMDMSDFTDRFEERLIDELLRPITDDGRIDIGLQLKCRVFGEVDFTLFWDGQNRGRWVVPCFSNSLAGGIVTDDREDVSRLSRNMNDLFDEFLPTGGIVTSGRDFGY